MHTQSVSWCKGDNTRPGSCSFIVSRTKTYCDAFRRSGGGGVAVRSAHIYVKRCHFSVHQREILNIINNIKSVCYGFQFVLRR